MLLKETYAEYKELFLNLVLSCAAAGAVRPLNFSNLVNASTVFLPMEKPPMNPVDMQ